MMFADFDKAFKRNNQGLRIPSEIIASLNENLPKDFKYVDIGEGACTIRTDPSKMQLSMEVELPDDFNPKSSDELLEFMYRSQKELRIVPDKDGYITINDSKILLSDLVTFPFEGNKTIGTFHMIPEPFRPPFKVHIEGGGIRKDILIQRQPYPHFDKSLFKSVEESVLEVSYILDEVKETIKFNFNINIEKSNRVIDIIEGLKLYQACVSGQVIFAGINFSAFISENKDLQILKTINFWEKIESLERKIETNFILEFPITNEDALWIEKLYKSFIEDRAYKEYGNVEKVTTALPDEIDKDSFIKHGGLMFGVIQRSELTIWGVTLDLFNVVAMFDFKVTDLISVDKQKMNTNLL